MSSILDASRKLAFLEKEAFLGAMAAGVGKALAKPALKGGWGAAKFMAKRPMKTLAVGSLGLGVGQGFAQGVSAANPNAGNPLRAAKPLPRPQPTRPRY